MKKIGIVLLIIIGIILVGLLQSNEVKADESNEKYSIDYLLRHYNAVTFGTKENNILTEYKQTIQGTNKGDIKNLNVEGPALARGEYANKVNENVDFDKMYAQVMNESQILADKTEYTINDNLINIDKPGIYTISNTDLDDKGYYSSVRTYSGREYDYIQKNIVISNYNPNEYYIINIMNDIQTTNYNILLSDENTDGNAIGISNYILNSRYTGNIIFNYPNARYIRSNNNYTSIVAPKADILLDTDYNSYHNPITTFYGTILANSITEPGGMTLHSYFNKVQKHIELDNNNYIMEYNDYNDDIYNGDYSISTLLQNYSIISLGQKDYQSNTKFASLGYTKGSTGIFHISSQFLVNGDLGVEDEDYPGWRMAWQKEEGYMRIDLDSNHITESYLNGSLRAPMYIKFWKYNTDKYGSKNQMYIKSNNFYNYFAVYDAINSGRVDIPDSFINFNRLYTNIVKEQSAIEEGKKVKVGEDKIVHIPIGGNYTIDDISDVKEIMFDNFEKNKDEITIVTIKNSGNINFPLISKDTGDYKGIPTNDYYGKTVANQEYEMGGLLPDEYHGNIVFNVPNANYIKLAPNAPFAGHLIAPNADVETEETQLAGCMIVNSLYAEGGSEAHFYPITVDLKCDCEGYHNLSEDMKRKFSGFRLSKLLGGEATTIETEILGDEASYQEDIKTLENVEKQCPSNNQGASNPVVEILTNPKTYRNIGLILLIGITSILGIITYKKKQNS